MLHFFSAMLFLALASTSLTQDYLPFEWNKKSTLNADQKIELPGIVLDPGVYIVRLRETNDRRSYIDVLDQDETQVLASMVAVPDHHVRPEDNSEFTFHAVRQVEPKPVRTWYFPGDLVGLEFVYPKSRALDIARESDNHVMASNGSKGDAIVAVTPNGKEILIDGPITETARQKPQ